MLRVSTVIINDLALFTGTGSWLLMIVVYWVVGGIYTILDITNRPAALRRYKIQPGTNEPVDKRKLCKVIGQVLFNQTIVGFPVIYLSYYIMEWRGFPPVRELPTFHWVLAEIAIHILCEEIGFYYSHRYVPLRRSSKSPSASGHVGEPCARPIRCYRFILQIPSQGHSV